jgi:hypothetical protein
MKEFMLIIRNTMDHLSHLSQEENQQFLKACMDYIGILQDAGKLKAAQPMVKEGVIISGSDIAWKEVPFNETRDVMVGYYHILARDMSEAIEIAKGNPEFTYTTTARIEVRPVKMKEASTGFNYPTE